MSLTQRGSLYQLHMYHTDGWHVLSKFIRSPAYQVIHDGCVCCKSLRGIPLRSAWLLVNQCVHEQGTFPWAFQATTGQQEMLDCCGTAAEKGKFLLPLCQKFHVGITSTEDTSDLLSLRGESLGCLVLFSATCPGTVYTWDCVVLAHVYSDLPNVSCHPWMGVMLVLCVQEYLLYLMGCDVCKNPDW